MSDENAHDYALGGVAAQEIMRLIGELAQKDEQIAALQAALPDSKKLRLLADWFDVYDKRQGWTGNGVQDDLRRWAVLADTETKP